MINLLPNNPEKNPNNIKIKCPFCNKLYFIFIHPKSDTGGGNVRCFCGKIFTFIEKLQLMEIDGIANSTTE